MKNLIFLFFATIPSVMMAQEFAPIGAIWHYTQYSLDPELITYKTIESVSDTAINGKECKKIIEVERYYSDTICTYTHYMYTENDSVLFFKDNAFHVLYDFGAEAGDTVVLDYYLTGGGTPLLMMIDSTGIIDINGFPYKIQYTTCGDGYYIEFGGPVIEGIGGTYFMFPTYDGNLNGPLRCYNDEVVGLYINYFNCQYGWDFENCDQIISDIEEPDLTDLALVYPNPFINHIFIKNVDPAVEFRIIDMSGNLLKKGQPDLSGKLKTEELTRGLYFLEIRTESSVTVKKIIRNE